MLGEDAGHEDSSLLICEFVLEVGCDGLGSSKDDDEGYSILVGVIGVVIDGESVVFFLLDERWEVGWFGISECLMFFVFGVKGDGIGHDAVEQVSFEEVDAGLACGRLIEFDLSVAKSQGVEFDLFDHFLLSGEGFCSSGLDESFGFFSGHGVPLSGLCFDLEYGFGCGIGSGERDGFY